MKQYAIVFISSLVFSLLLTHMAGVLGRRLGIYDEPHRREASQKRIPRSGGLAIAVSFFVSVLAFLDWNGLTGKLLAEDGRPFLAIFIGGLLAFAVGLWDDIYHLRAGYKLSFQILISVVVYLMGVQIHTINVPFLGLMGIGGYSFPMTVIWIVGVMNSINLIDGIDGLCASVCLVASSAFFVLALATNCPLVAVLSIALVGTILGFLLFNFAPASIFMGDSGSYFLGFTLAALPIVYFFKTSAAFSLTTPVLFMAIPLFDTLHTIVRRIIHSRPIAVPDRGHLHHRLLSEGQSPRRIAIMMFCFSAILAIIGIIASTSDARSVLISLVAAAIILNFLFRFFGISPAILVKASHE